MKTSLLSAYEKVRKVNEKQIGLHECLSTISRLPSGLPKFKKQVFEYDLFLKNYPFHSYQSLQRKIRESKDTSLKILHKNWLAERKKYFGAIRFKVQSQNSQPDSLQRKIKTMEEELCRRTGLESKVENYSEEHFAKIKSALMKKELAIEFLLYEDVIKKKYMYGAFILASNKEAPEFLPLCSAEELSVATQRQQMESEFKHVQRTYDQDELYKLIWVKILEKYPSIQHVYVSLTGILNYISHGALLADTDTYLMDKLDITIVNSTKDIPNRGNGEISLSQAKAVVFGGIDYTIEEDQILQNSEQNTVYNKFRGQILGNWEYLGNTKSEVEGIKTLLEENKVEVFKYIGLQASETQFIHSFEKYQPDIIHLATHGLFIEGKKDEKHHTLDCKSYTHSGLIMAGANTCQKLQASIEEYGDGVFTAPEIASYNLSNTKLVVLSACESGLGNVSNIGTSYGLQRAFKTAGADYVIYSLWKVSDKTTKEFMLSFYGHLCNGMSIENAFKKSKRTMRQLYEPFHWAAFQLRG